MDAAPVPIAAFAIPALAPVSDSDAVADALFRVARLAAHAFGVPFAQIVRYEAVGGPGGADGWGDGYGLQAALPPPVSYGHVGGSVPDLRLACTRLPADAALVLVEDAAKDGRFVGVLPPEGRFFAYAALDGLNGPSPGALCLLDRRPHAPGTVHADALLDLTILAADLLHARAVSDASAEALRVAEGRLLATTSRLSESEARFRALGEAIFGAVFVSEHGLILDANDQAAALFGHPDPEPFIGRPLAALAPAGDAISAAALADDAPTEAVREAAIARADGSPLPVRFNVRAFPFEGRELRFTVFYPEG